MGASSIIFCHVPWRRLDAGGVVRRRIMAIPSGMFTLAALAERAGWESSLIHLGLEELHDPGYRLEQDVAAREARIVAFDLQWHPQLAGVLEAARRVKHACPGAQVLLGGITASYFRHELLEHCVDFVIRGDAERPLELLLAELAQRAPLLSRVPNLSWRAPGGVVHNPETWVATSAELDAAELDLRLLKHASSYDGAIEDPKPAGVRDPLWGRPRCFHVVVGRGCSRACAYCGGAQAALEQTYGRRGVVLRSAARLLPELYYLAQEGFHTLYFAFDPPGTTGLYLELFERVARGGALPGAVLEQYDGLPAEELLAAFGRAFGERTVALSPGSAVPELRARHRLFNPKNEAVEDAVRRIKDSGARALVYFTLFPDDSVESLSRTADWMVELRGRLGADLQFVTIEIEPGAAWHSEPERYGVELQRRSFADFLQHHQSGDPSDLGYRVRDEERKRRIVSEVVQPLIAAPTEARC